MKEMKKHEEKKEMKKVEKKKSAVKTGPVSLKNKMASK